MKHLTKVLTVIIFVGLFLFSCAKFTETNQADAQDMKSSNQGTPWIQASASATQLIISSPQQAIIDNLDGSSDKVELNGGEITVKHGGEYLIIAAPQVGRNTGSPSIANFRCWLRVNGTDVTNSNVLLNLKPWTKDVIITQGIVSLNADDVVTVMIASDNDNVVMIEAIQLPNEPLVPSIIFTMFKTN